MKVHTLAAAAALALQGVFAHPTIHHLHHHKLHLRDVLDKRVDYDTSQVDWSKVDWSKVDWDKVFGKSNGGGSANPPAPSSSSQSTPNTEQKQQTSEKQTKAPEKQNTTPSVGKCANVASKNKRATQEQDGYVGDYQGNILAEPNCQSSGDYSITFTNSGGEKKTYWLWNKIGSDGQQDGMMKDPAETFDLGPGQSATFTFKPNSQVGFSEACGRAVNNGNVPNCNCGEANFNDQNAQGGAVGGSFYDVSMVTYNQIKQAGGNPVLVPMEISADGYDPSTNENCMYAQPGDNSPQNPGSSGKCYCGPNDSRPFHITATFS